MQVVLDYLQNHWALVAWVLCEILAALPNVKSSSIGTLVYNMLKGMVGSNPPAPLP